MIDKPSEKCVFPASTEPLPTEFSCIDPDDGKAALAHFHLCLRCQELVGEAVVKRASTEQAGEHGHCRYCGVSGPTIGSAVYGRFCSMEHLDKWKLSPQGRWDYENTFAAAAPATPVAQPEVRAISDTEMDEINAGIRQRFNEDVSARDCMAASEPVLAREWSTPEEDEAWKDLGVAQPEADPALVQDVEIVEQLDGSRLQNAEQLNEAYRQRFEAQQSLATARADAIEEAVEIAKAHVHISACDGIGCKQVIAAALEALKGTR